MTKYIAVFKSGKEIVRTTADGFRNRLDFYNWICENKLGVKYGEVVKIECRPTVK